MIRKPKRKLYEKMNSKEFKEMSEQYQPKIGSEVDNKYKQLLDELVEIIDNNIPIGKQRRFINDVLEGLEHKFVSRAENLTKEFEANQVNYEHFKNGTE